MAIPAELQGKASGDAVYFPIAAKDIGSGERALAAMMYGVDTLGQPAPFVLLDGSLAFTIPDPTLIWTSTTGIALAAGVNVLGVTSIPMAAFRGITGHIKPSVAGTFTIDWSDDADFSDYYVRDTEREVPVTTDGITINVRRYGDYARLIFTAAGVGTIRGNARKDKWG